ncbi:MAG: acetate kinase [Firmicutes bacterium]|nr:acetate kinase [Bacillota bacterium]
MKILVLNCGSSTLKHQLIDMQTERVIASGVFESIGGENSHYWYGYRGPEQRTDVAIQTHKEAVKILLELLGDQVKSIRAIGHRVVHGGEKYRASIIATPEVLAGVDSVSHFAPLHNPKNLMGVHACMSVFGPDIPNVLVFDTAFHGTIPNYAHLYAIPQCEYNDHGVRKYGFHGTSYAYVSRVAAQMYGKNPRDLKMVIAHLGNGASMCAINGGKSLDTSMGMTPLEGLIMGTRCGDIDPGAVAHLARAKELSADAMMAYLNNSCGLAGLSGMGTSDMRTITANRETDAGAKLAFDAYVHRAVRYMGGYIAALGGVDAIVFTGGVGCNNIAVRRAIMEKLQFLGADINWGIGDKLNGTGDGRNGTAEISAPNARIRTFVITTNEELEIATEAKKLLDNPNT